MKGSNSVYQSGSHASTRCPDLESFAAVLTVSFDVDHGCGIDNFSIIWSYLDDIIGQIKSSRDFTERARDEGSKDGS